MKLPPNANTEKRNRINKFSIYSSFGNKHNLFLRNYQML
jgi:hypothetical protein